MSKKKKHNPETTITNYYDLKSDKVDELVSALKDGESAKEAEPVTTNIGEITGEAEQKDKHFDPYKIDKLSRIPVPVKALFIKWWFCGVACYFFMMALGINIDALDQMVITGIGLGIIVDIFVNPIYRFLETDEREYNNYMMFPFPFKAYWTFLANMAYYLVVVTLVAFVYRFLHDANMPVGVEPLLFATFCLIIDMAFIGVKDLIVFVVKRGISRSRGGGSSAGDEA